MSRIYLDTMILVYLSEEHPTYSPLVKKILTAAFRRGDTLCTSLFTLGELLVAPKKTGDVAFEHKIRGLFSNGSIEVISIDSDAMNMFAEIRATKSVKPADAIHLACASRAKTDLFLTNDQAIRNLIIPGIKFIDGLETTVFGD